MKFIASIAAGLVAATALTPVPAQAQRYGNGYGYDRGDDGGRNGRRWHDDRRWQGERGWDRGWHSGRGWRDHSRVRCTWVRGYYGRQRQCYRVYR